MTNVILISSISPFVELQNNESIGALRCGNIILHVIAIMQLFSYCLRALVLTRKSAILEQLSGLRNQKC